MSQSVSQSVRLRNVELASQLNINFSGIHAYFQFYLCQVFRGISDATLNEMQETDPFRHMISMQARFLQAHRLGKLDGMQLNVGRLTGA